MHFIAGMRFINMELILTLSSLTIYALILAIKALKIYIRSNS